MSSERANMIMDCLQDLKADLDSPYFTIFNRRIECVPNRLKENTRLEIGGYVMDVDLWFYVLVTDLPEGVTVDDTSITVDTRLTTTDVHYPQPRHGNVIEFEGSEYRIMRNIESPCGTFYKMFTETVDR